MVAEIVPGVVQVLSGIVNAYVVQTPDGLVLIDTGMPGSEGKILAALREAGHEPGDLKHIIVTHAHPDHLGSVAALKQATGAEIWAHKLDVPVIESGTLRPVYAAPGLAAHVFHFLIHLIPLKIVPARVDHAVSDGDALPGGLRAVHLPGHCAGLIALLLPERGILFVGDSAMNTRGLKTLRMNEDLALARQSAARIGKLDFDIAIFGHGAPILGGAAQAFRTAFPG